MTSATGACGLRVGEGSPASLPTAPPHEVVRDGLARQAALIASIAQVVSDSGTAQPSAPVDAIAASAATQLNALGGVWDPWATPVPTSYQTVPPVPSAAADVSTADLTTALTDGTALAREAAAACADDDAARLYAALAVAWSLEATRLDAAAVAVSGRDASALTEALPGDLLSAYDAARYASEEIAARSTGANHTRALADVAYAKAVVSASVALGGQDTRLAAYAAPTARADDSTSLEVTWARQVWQRVEETELAGVRAAGANATEITVDAALEAALRARAWGAAVDDPLPGYLD
ncbi:Tat pathway signal protein [Actinomyces qiguomingii]|uniref:Tat pathway signal protein n=2 Tax=Actinomyces qiguomingii TaxID=2057800 RepID=UPI001FD4D81D|nr:Tat pathway signal protein [Actinomyces qiguomingii]